MIFENLLCKSLADYYHTREHLVIRACNYAKNKPRLRNIPHRVIADLALTCHLMERAEAGGICTTVVDYGMLEWMDIQEEQLFEDAFAFSPSNLPPLIRPMESVINIIMGLEPDIPLRIPLEEQIMRFCIRDDMPVLTNLENMNGAAVLFYPGVMELIGERMQTDYFILPSSVHETILLPDDGTYLLSDLKEMVTEINRTEIRQQDYLSDSVYHYDRAKRLFAQAS
ncbi:MAG: hypothetical protein J5483_01900 [Lachnospiraceae bacterium]|nr:hypothetical protein [Lachnospiraceae bacterium]